MPKSPYFERIPSFEGETARALEMARPRRGEAEKLDLTPEEQERVDVLLSQAKQAETAAKQEPDEQKRIALYEQALDLYTQVKTDLLSIKEKKEKEKRGESGELKFIIPDALNPYREALLAGGIPETDPVAVEQKDIEIDLEKVIDDDIASYRASGLEHWVQALEAIKGDIRLTPEKRQIIEQEIKDGAIAIFMPGSASQLETTPEQYQKNLKPVWIKDGEEQVVADTYMWDHTASLITDKAPELVQDVPERPYIFLIKPTQRPEPRTTDKTVDQQKVELRAINQERQEQGQAPVFFINPAEYGSFQKRFTETAKDVSPQPLQTLNPLDTDTWTRFIHLPLSGGRVPGGGWDSVNRQLGLDWGGAGNRGSHSGFRLSVRVEV